jgi:hypothetical protein
MSEDALKRLEDLKEQGFAPNAPASGSTVATVARRRVRPENLPARKAGFDRSFWYLDSNDPELAKVTDEDSNPELGILRIGFYETDRNDLASKNILGSVRLETVIGAVSGISVFFTQHPDGQVSVSCTNSSARVVNTAGETSTKELVRLDKAVKAQINRYIHKMYN